MQGHRMEGKSDGRREWKARSKREAGRRVQEVRVPAVQAKVKEGFDQIERGEYVSIPIDEIKRRLRDLGIG